MEVYTQLSRRSQALLRKLFSGQNGVRTRHLALEPLSEAGAFNPDTLQQRFEVHAPALAGEAATRALADAALMPSLIDAVLVSTCTGYLCPGISTYLVERLRLRPDVMALDFVGGGCGAAVPNLETARALLASGLCRHVLSVCVEVCSAAFYLDEDPGVQVSLCLFGDGAAAAVLQADHTDTPYGGPGRRAHWLASASLTDPAFRDVLRFEHRGGMLRNILKPLVPQLAAEHAEMVLDRVLKENGLTRADISTWIWHGGGRDVLAAIRERIGLERDATRWSESVLAEYGNLSSASVLFALQEALRDGAPPGWWWLSSFGAGFSCHGALLQVR
jgi:alkylresorcinol/alkylpyrone synthase